MLNIPTMTIFFRWTIYMHNLELGSILKLRLSWKIKGEIFCGLLVCFLKRGKSRLLNAKYCGTPLSHVILFSWRNHPQNILLSRFICEEGEGHLRCICPSTSEGALRSLRDVLSISLSTKVTLPQPALIGPEVWAYDTRRANQIFFRRNLESRFRDRTGTSKTINSLEERVLVSGESLLEDRRGRMGGAKNSQSALEAGRKFALLFTQGERWRSLVEVRWSGEWETPEQTGWCVGTKEKNSWLASCREALGSWGDLKNMLGRVLGPSLELLSKRGWVAHDFQRTGCFRSGTESSVRGETGPGSGRGGQPAFALSG